MARIVLTSIVAHPDPLFAPGGDVSRWSAQITREVKMAARLLAPPIRSTSKYGRRSSGAMRKSITGKSRRRGRLLMSGDVSVNVYYAKWVLGGTAHQGRRYIYSTAGWANKAEVDAMANRVARGGKAHEDDIERGLYMRLPLTGYGGKRAYHLRVHGQRANPFLTDGYNVVAHRHGALKPMRNKYVF